MYLVEIYADTFEKEREIDKDRQRQIEEDMDRQRSEQQREVDLKF